MADIKLGLNTGYWSSGPPAGAADSIAEAERLGFDSIWTAEAYGSDALTPLAWWGARTERVKLGTETVTDEETVTEEVRKEHIEAEGDVDDRRGTR